MAHPYSRVTHRPAVLMFDPEGHLLIVVAGHLLGLFAGLKLPRRMPADRLLPGSGSDAEQATDRPADDGCKAMHGVPSDTDERMEC